MELDQETIDKAIAEIEFKASILGSENGKYLLINEARMARKLNRSFKAQMEWIIEKAAELSFFNNKSSVLRLERKTVQDEVNGMLDDMPENEELADIIANGGETVYKKGAKTSYTKFSMADIGMNFDLVNPYAVDYLKAKKTLHLSDYRGSIKRTTKKQILKILTEAAETGQSYQETGKKIRAQGSSGVFSRFRSEMIATNEIRHAYEEGNHKMIDLYKNETGTIIQKMWLTKQDSQVTEECAANEAVGWIGWEEHFPSGDEISPRGNHPRCRCSMGYRAVDTQGNPL